jgi:hypothetical protein
MLQGTINCTPQGWRPCAKVSIEMPADLCQPHIPPLHLPAPHLLHQLLLRLVHNVPVQCSTNVVEQQDVAIGAAAGEQGGGVDGAQGGDALQTENVAITNNTQYVSLMTRFPWGTSYFNHIGRLKSLELEHQARHRHAGCAPLLCT